MHTEAVVARSGLADSHQGKLAFTSEAGRHYMRRVVPYRTEDRRIDGVVITFTDITELKEGEGERAQLASIVSLVWLGGMLSAFGGIPLLSGTTATTNGRFAAVAKLLVGIGVLAVAFWLRHRERRAIARGTMPPNEEL